jgi:molecular chaperone GrpE
LDFPFFAALFRLFHRLRFAMSEQNTPLPQSDAGGVSDLPGAVPMEPDSVQARIAALEAERNDARDRMLRIAADFENYKKRVRKEQSDSEIKARESVLKDVLEVADNLERAAAVDANADFKSLQKGVELVNRLLQGKLERYEVRAFESKGQPFDPRVHDAVSQLPTPDAAPGSVVGEVQKGYRIGDRLLRPALVVVAVAPPQSDGAGGSST